MTASREIFSVKGVWGYEQLARMGLTDGQLFLSTVGTSLLIHGLLLVLWGGEPLGRFGIPASVMVLPTAFLSGLYVFLTVRQDKDVYRRLIRRLAKVDPNVADFGRYLTPEPSRLLVRVTLWVVTLFGFLSFMTLDVIGMNVLNASEVFGTGSSAWLFWYFAVPINVLLISIMLGVSTNRCSTELAKQIDIDIFRLDDYACLSSTAVSTFGFVSLLTGFVGAWALLTPSGAALQMFLYLGGAAVVFGTAAIATDVYPIVVFARRFRAAVGAEQARVRLAIAGDVSALAQSRISGDEDRLRKTDLINYLVTLNTLPVWPIGPYVRNIVAFGLLPPIAWTLAAVIENTIY